MKKQKKVSSALGLTATKKEESKRLDLDVNTTFLIMQEMRSIPEKFRKPFNSAHEGYAIIKEEVDELWDEVKNGEKRLMKEFYTPGVHGQVEARHKMLMRKEAVQIAAMCVRFIQEVCK